MEKKITYLRFILSMILLFCIIFATFSSNTFGAEVKEIVVNSAAELKSKMENPAGSNIKLGANITFPASLRKDNAIEMRGGSHILNLNGYSIEYSYVNSDREYSGSPIRLDGSLTINGSGTIKGGYCAIEVGGWDNVLIINGGSYTGIAATAIRAGGLTIFNGGTLSGRFGDVGLGGGIVVDNVGIVKKTSDPFNVGGAIIRNGVLSGKAELHAPLTLNNLQMAANSSLTIKKWGVLNVTGSLMGEERIFLDGGLLLKNGVATIKDNMRLDRNHNLTQISDINLTQLNVLSGVELIITDEMKINISNDLNNHGKIHVQSGSVLTVEGNLINSGEIIFDNSEGLILKGRLDNTGKISEFRHANNDHEAPSPELGRMIRAADTLFGLGLFKGTGTDSNGLPIYDLEVAPTRQVAITMLVRLLGKEKEALSNTWYHPFDDVDSWANPYVGYAYSKGGCCTKKFSVPALLYLKSKFQTSKSPEFGVKYFYANKKFNT